MLLSASEFSVPLAQIRRQKRFLRPLEFAGDGRVNHVAKAAHAERAGRGCGKKAAARKQVVRGTAGVTALMALGERGSVFVFEMEERSQ